MWPEGCRVTHPVGQIWLAIVKIGITTTEVLLSKVLNSNSSSGAAQCSPDQTGGCVTVCDQGASETESNALSEPHPTPRRGEIAPFCPVLCGESGKLSTSLRANIY